MGRRLRRAAKFGKSLVRHASLGFPVAPEHVIRERYEICLKCEEYDVERQECSACECSVGPSPAFVNKCAWADEECPYLKWRCCDG